MIFKVCRKIKLKKFGFQVCNILEPDPDPNYFNSDQCCGAGPFLTGSGYYFRGLRLQLL